MDKCTYCGMSVPSGCEHICQMEEDRREALAALAHTQWSGWMKYMFSCGEFQNNGTWVMPHELVDRWQRQMNANYDELPENEKPSDRVEADRMIEIYEHFYQEWE